MEIEFISRRCLATDIYSFHFTKPPLFTFEAGDYIELGLDFGQHGGRRWFSLASSPTEAELMITTHIPTPMSEYKKALSTLKPQAKVQISPPIGTFNLPRNNQQPLLFIAAGVGITPFRSMCKWIVDTKSKYEITLLYAVRTPTEFIFMDIIKAIPNVKIVQLLTQPEPTWTGYVSSLNLEAVRKLVPGYEQKLIYLSGAQVVIEDLYNNFLKTGIKRDQLMLDYFTGYQDL